MSSILITGASHGVGKAFALACAQSGRFSRIILNGGSDAAALEDTARRVLAAGDLFCAADTGDVGDVSDRESIDVQLTAKAAGYESSLDNMGALITVFRYD